MLLDKVQKHKELSVDEVKFLRKHNYIEGRKPNYFLSAKVVKPTKNRKLKSEYIHNKAFDNEHYRNLILQYIDKFGRAMREDIDDLLWNKLPAHLDDDENKKKAKIGNLLSSLRIAGFIKFENGFWLKC